ncbi:MAG: RcpC/CpaB family pilus assembly protein, partial [Sneathiella sp.]
SVLRQRNGSLADILQPGNRIDLLVKLENRELETLDSGPLTGLVGSNIRLIGKPTAGGKPLRADRTGNYDLYVLEIPEAQIERVSLAQALGSVTALLRSSKARSNPLPLLGSSDLRAFSQRLKHVVDEGERLFQSVVIQRGREMSIHESAVPGYRGRTHDRPSSNVKGEDKG